MEISLKIPALDQIAANLAQLVTIQQQRAIQESKNMIAASDVKALIDDFNAVTLADASDKAALLTAQQNLAALQQSVADLNDPALASSLATALANAAGSTPPATPVVNAPPTPLNPVATDPTAPVVPDPNASAAPVVPDPSAPATPVVPDPNAPQQ